MKDGIYKQSNGVCFVIKNGFVGQGKGPSGSWRSQGLYFPVDHPGLVDVGEKFYQYLADNGFEIGNRGRLVSIPAPAVTAPAPAVTAPAPAVTAPAPAPAVTAPAPAVTAPAPAPAPQIDPQTLHIMHTYLRGIGIDLPAPPAPAPAPAVTAPAPAVTAPAPAPAPGITDRIIELAIQDRIQGFAPTHFSHIGKRLVTIGVQYCTEYGAIYRNAWASAGATPALDQSKTR
jgi:hypothetical protein